MDRASRRKRALVHLRPLHRAHLFACICESQFSTFLLREHENSSSLLGSRGLLPGNLRLCFGRGTSSNKARASTGPAHRGIRLVRRRYEYRARAVRHNHGTSTARNTPAIRVALPRRCGSDHLRRVPLRLALGDAAAG